MDIKIINERMDEIQVSYNKVVESIQKAQGELQSLVQEKTRLEGAYYELDNLVKLLQNQVADPDSSNLDS